MGMLPITTATKVSRQAQLPACWAPFKGSYKERKTCYQQVFNTTMLFTEDQLTARMRAHRRIPAIMTNMPPLNMTRSRYFRLFFKFDFHSIYHVPLLVFFLHHLCVMFVLCPLLVMLTGKIMDMRYISVETFNTTVTQRFILDIAGWQWSGSRKHRG